MTPVSNRDRKRLRIEAEPDILGVEQNVRGTATGGSKCQ